MGRRQDKENLPTPPHHKHTNPTVPTNQMIRCNPALGDGGKEEIPFKQEENSGKAKHKN